MEAGVDNQLYRAVGCARTCAVLARRPRGPHRSVPDRNRGVDDPQNDDHVEVGIYSTDDTPLQGPDGKAMANQTLAITNNPRWRPSPVAL